MDVGQDLGEERGVSPEDLIEGTGRSARHTTQARPPAH
jgi:hypothetical protein